MKLFVYGTLLSGQGANYKLTEMGARLICKDTFNADMFTHNLSYPFLMEGKFVDSVVQGEVYEIGDESLAKCDAYEGYKQDAPERCLFLRSMGTTGSGHEVFYYHAGPRLVEHLNSTNTVMLPIRSGDWKEFESNDLPILLGLRKQWMNDMLVSLHKAGMIKKPRKAKRPKASLSSD